ncbi:DeoR/GlpR family DNA-binding transcription regulator [Streptomyces sp. Ru73]|uniref:DeoR/GlpR family DNA-binding transcription regulator n=1 Tax=Streptomyces sp. Ru73 TaxID=2080748 RepID=UPI0021562E52|nr:DeoR/GlpR family DNA-binding transcription regulator [Streptomyces sp. Ru73]
MSAKARLSQAAVERRRQDVLRYVAERGEIRIDALAAHFGLSLMTMHRDLDDLAGRGLLRKERGRAVAFPALTMETATRFREGANREVKAALCAAAAERIRPGSTLLIDDSTTLYPLADALATTEGIRVVTNSVGLAQRLSAAAGTDVTLLGGQYQGDFHSCTGPEVTRTLSRIRADLALMSATAVHDGRLFHPLPEFVEVKEAMLAAAASSLLLADHSKFGKTATYGYGDVGRYEAVLTDPGTDARETAAMRELGATITIVAYGGGASS